MNANTKIGFIGYGNMAQAIAAGLVLNKVIKPSNIFANAKHYDKLCKNVKKLKINPVKNLSDLVLKVDYVIVAVKPQQVKEIILPLKNALKNKVIISVAAGLQYNFYQEILLKNTAHISTIPNIAISVGQGIIICENKHLLLNKQLKQFKSIFGKIALVEFVETSQFSVAGTLSGCTPAFTAIYLEALADGAVKYGLPRSKAYKIASKMIIGTGKIYLENEIHPGIIKDSICSPGGSTIKGVAALEENGFRGSIIKAIESIED